MKNKEKGKGMTKVIVIAVLIILIFLLFPRRYSLKDGGSVIWGSIGYGCIYTIELRHKLPISVDERGYGYYENGVIISVLGITIFNNSSTDYSDIAIAPHDQYHESAPI